MTVWDGWKSPPGTWQELRCRGLSSDGMSWETGESSQKAGVRKESVVWVEKLSEDPGSDGARCLGL